MSEDLFRSAGYAWRLFCGPAAIEAHLKAAVGRAGAKRAFVICSPSVKNRTATVTRIEAALGDAYAGSFDGIEKDSTYASVQAGKAAAAAAGADLLVAAGGGSVIVATRAIAIFLSEAGDPFEIMTQYPAGGRPYSPRLMAPKPPIINIPTTPTSAMNRAGSGLKNSDLDHRMEYFDPKTRPQAILLDDDVLLSTPPWLLKSTATTVFAAAVGSVALTPVNPLVDGDQRQAFRLAHNAYLRLNDEPRNPALRRDLCLAAFLQNRAEDDGRPLVMRGPFAGNYAVATALHLQYPDIGQGEATAVLHGTSIRLGDDIDLAAARRTAEVLGIGSDRLDAREAAHAVAARLEEIYRGIGMPVRLRETSVAQKDFVTIAAETVKNFNARGSLTSAEDRVAESLKLLEAAW